MFFADTWLFWIFAGLYVLWLGLWFWGKIFRGGRRRMSASLRFSSTESLKQLRPSRMIRLRPWVEGLRLVAVALLVLGMGRPQTGRSKTRVVTEGVDILLAIDTSRSMEALDLDASRAIAKRRNRLNVVKDVVDRFIARRENDQLGIVVFGSEAYSQCPLTLDHGIVSSFLEQIEIGMAGDATAIGSAVGTAVKRLRKSKAKSKVVVLLTDGRSNTGALSPTKAAEVAKTFGIKVYTIGAGTRGKAPVLVDTVFGQHVSYMDADLDEVTLKKIAETTHGKYFRAEDEKALDAIYEEIDQLEKTEIEMQSYMEYNERFDWFILPALFLLLAEVLLMGTRFKKIP